MSPSNPANSPASVPVITFDTTLPIAEHADEIAELVAANQVVIVAGETGSGKTTQLPKICLRLGRKRIAHTQPRRIAARSVAERLADELQVTLGEFVGYQVRFTRKVGRDTAIKVMTDGVLLAELGRDKDLRRYDTIIIDEAHERSLNIDFLLGYLKQLLPRRPELKVIVTSATIDTARFSEHFQHAPIIEVSGRSYPVEMRYRPLASPEQDVDDAIDQTDGIVRAVRELATEGPGDVLVFLSGEREIRDAADALTAAELPDTHALPLYARLSAAEQHQVFSSHTGRRVVLATNIAETSLTVPGIRYVVDPGTARISRYSARTKVQRLPIEAISQASANQRAGRCGRLGPGICIRLYSEDDFLTRPDFTEPEILRTNLASVILQMTQAGLGDIQKFPFVEPPDGTQITDGLRLLDELGAIRSGSRQHPKLTRTGQQLARIPLDPRLGRMLVEAARRDCLAEVQVIVAGLAIPDVRERPAEHREKADTLHRRFHSEAIFSAPSPEPTDTTTVARHTPHTNTRPEKGEQPEGGDVLAVHRLWRYLRQQRKQLSGNAFRRMCRDEYLNFLRVREWEDLNTQLREISRELQLPRNSQPAPSEEILTSVLSGLLSHVGLADVTEPTTKQVGRRRKRPGPREYLGARGARFAINPGSSLVKSPPPLVMAFELVETTRLWARIVAGIDASWVEQVGGHLLKRQYSEPHWSSASGAVLAHEKVSLYGVPIVADRMVNYARIDPQQAREIFIRSALVEGAWATRHDFFHRNAEVRSAAEQLEERARRRDIMVDDETLFGFYDARIPQEVVSVRHFDAWWRKQDDPTLLDLSLDDLVVDASSAVDGSDFPDTWRIGDVELPVAYVFEPGAGHDGVTVTIGLERLNQLTAEPFSWQVPGLRHELATELIRSLPKQLRTNFVPAPDHARTALRWLEEHQGDHRRYLHQELGRALRQLTGVQVPDDGWRPDAVPQHLRVAFTITQKGAPPRYSESFSAVREELADRLSATLTRAAKRAAVTGATTWSFGAIDTTTTIKDRAHLAIGYPALRDDGDSVAVVVLDAEPRAEMSHRAGLNRLLLLNTPDPTKWVVAHLSNVDKLALGNSPYPSVPYLLADARLKAVDRLVQRDGGAQRVRNVDAFARLSVQVRENQADTMRQVVGTAAEVCRLASEVSLSLSKRSGTPVAEDLGAQLANLVFVNFLSATDDPWLHHLPRYLKAMLFRLDTAAANPARDRQQAEQVDALEVEYAELVDEQPEGPLVPAVEQIGFLIEELRVQTFAQQLRTSVSVSAKRIRSAIRAARG